jgi:hypothetical protein
VQTRKPACRGAQIRFTLDETAHGSVAVQLGLGTDEVCCMRFGCRVQADVPGRFQAFRAPPPAACP